MKFKVRWYNKVGSTYTMMAELFDDLTSAINLFELLLDVDNVCGLSIIRVTLSD